MIDEKELWEQCVKFHGHTCGGLTIGYKTSLYAMKLLGLDFSEDEDVVCVSENDACGVDAIQVILGCSVGKGNLLFHPRGKQAFTFHNRANEKSVRLVLKDRPEGITREASFSYMQERSPEELFVVKEAVIQIPEKAKIFNSVTCEHCKESTAETMIRLEDGKCLCLDCYFPYSRFDDSVK
ncbi:FmdE family protein [Parasporobacterium paucivorans]|uniref:Formylmethanofuran dehydrogenase subunit E n=1 Tax=Parasporobacterium paucivorans DSM 15970 TaxID=1122934 RepID=A0A1M6I416_9FIRM|nr:FmdE family protein [Parasporobacterium paucivorans]SHJ29208.1 formylmethanofuran dehydrogenase subunit E [Parasporobacterium paucivorans DSM 15970]